MAEQPGSVVCRQCGKTILFAPKMAGKTKSCPKCNSPVELAAGEPEFVPVSEFTDDRPFTYKFRDVVIVVGFCLLIGIVGFIGLLTLINGFDLLSKADSAERPSMNSDFSINTQLNTPAQLLFDIKMTLRGYANNLTALVVFYADWKLIQLMRSLMDKNRVRDQQ